MSMGACSAWAGHAHGVEDPCNSPAEIGLFPATLDNLLLCIVRIVAIAVGHLDTEIAARRPPTWETSTQHPGPHSGHRKH